MWLRPCSLRSADLSQEQSILFTTCPSFTTYQLSLFFRSKDIDLERIGLIDADSASLDVVATSAAVHNSTASDCDIVAVLCS